MKRMTLKMNCALAVVFAGILTVGPAIADKPSWAGGKGKKHEQSDDNRGQSHQGDKKSPHDNSNDHRRSDHFDDHHRTYARDYYNEQYRRGRCPPGLAKKHNGCMPPGQARKWVVGRPLPREVIYYEVPPTLVVQFGQPQAGYRYVRVASDILLIAIGTGLVIDAIQDLGR